MPLRTASQWRNRLVRMLETVRSGHDIAAVRLVVEGLRTDGRDEAGVPVEALCDALESPDGEEARIGLGRVLRERIGASRLLPALTRSGIPGTESFGAELMARVGRRVLPPVPDPGDLRDLLREVFTHPRDHVWVAAVPESSWRRLLSALDITAEEFPGVGEELALAVRIVGHHVSSLGVEPELIDRLPHLGGPESPFLRVGRQVLRYLESFENDVEGDEEPLLEEALATVARCRSEVERLRAEKHLHGTSLHLTSFTFRLRALIDRLDVLLHLTEPVERDFQGSLVRLFRELLRAEQTRDHLRPHLRASADLLAHQVVEHVARKGSKYITSGRADYVRFLTSSMGGGLIVALFALGKLFLDRLPVPLAVEAFFFGLNYAICFVLIYLTGATLATKQPAMTANTLARSLGEDGHELSGLEDLVVRVWRSQFISFVGNLIIAFPVALALSRGLDAGLTWVAADPDKARSLLESLHPLRSGTVFYAAVAGVLLFAAGLLSGWVDNVLLHRDVSGRIAHHPWVRRLVGPTGAMRLAAGLDRTMGVIVGNVFLGFGLGSTGTLGEILGLPLDIRHIAFSSAHFGVALDTLDYAVAPSVIAWTATGVALVGLVNFLVSFGLSLGVALDSRGVTFRETRLLLLHLLARLRRRPLDWFVPPRSAPRGEPASSWYPGRSRLMLEQDRAESRRSRSEATMADLHDLGGVDTALGLPAARGILDGVLGALPGVVYRCRDDADWTMLGITANVVELTGYTPHDLIGNAVRSYADLIHPDDREKVEAAVQRGVASNRPFRAVYRIVDREGRTRWVLEQGRAVENGELTGYIQDLTSPLDDRLVWQQDELDRARRQTRHLELLQEVTAIVNESTTLEDALGAALPAICRGLGFVVGHVFLPAPDGAGLAVGDLWCLQRDTEEMQAFLEVVRRRHGDPERGVPGRVRREGEAEWIVDLHDDPDFADVEPCEGCPVVSAVGVPIKSGERRLAVLEFYADHRVERDPDLESLLVQVGTQLGRAWEREQALRDREAGEERFRQLAEHIDDVFWIGSPDDHARDYVSPAYRDVWGRDPDELRAHPRRWLETVHPDDRERVEDVVRRRADRGYEIQYRIVRPDGGMRWIWDRAFPVENAEGEVARVVGVAEDVTERTKLEAQLRAAHRMEAVGRLAGGIAHDFNNLLTVIRAQSDFLMMDLPEESPLVEEVEVVRSAADRAAELTRQLLAFSREQVLRPRVVDLVEVVRNMEQLLIRVLGEDIRIETAFEPGLAPVRVDPAQLEQVIMNLAVNARDAMPEGGALTLRARSETLTAEVAAGRTELVVGAEYVRLDVADTGHGMDEAVRARIFEPFYTTKRSRGGTGLGLAMAYGIVKQSGGTIHVRSAPGQGTTFVLRFPPVEAEAPRVEAGEGDVLRPPGEVAGTILVVEDDPAVRRVARRTLSRKGLEVRVAADAENGLEILRAAPDAVGFLLTDLVLPGMSGRELLDEVRRRYPQIRCIAMSGYAEGSPDSRVDLPTDVAFIQKPFTSEGLLRALDAVAD